MRGDTLGRLAIGAWVLLIALIGVGAAVLPKTETWGRSPVGVGGSADGFCPEPVVLPSRPGSSARSEGGVQKRRAGVRKQMPRSFPKCWRRGLQLAASAGKAQWSPTEPPCWRHFAGPPRSVMWARRAPEEGRPGRAVADRSYARAHAAEVRGVALKLFEEIQGVDYAHLLRPDGPAPEASPQAETVSSRAGEGQARASSRTLSECPLRSFGVADAYLDEAGRPCVPYRLELSDGGVIRGELAFEYLDFGSGGRWYPVDGLDWLLKGDGP